MNNNPLINLLLKDLSLEQAQTIMSVIEQIVADMGWDQVPCQLQPAAPPDNDNTIGHC